MNNYICVTCGTQFPASEAPPERCPICEDNRQYIGHEGQRWTTLAEMRPSHKNLIKTEEPNLTGIGTTPKFAIGQRALLVQSPGGNILWDCISFLDDDTIAEVNQLGGISAIAISHPHFYSSMIEWSHAFDAPIYIHESERPWVMRPDDNINFWQGETHPFHDNITLIRCGGHFPGSQVLHWADGADGKGVLLTADTVMVIQDRRYVSFMYSYPNYIPLNAAAVRQITNALEPFTYDRIYSGWFGSVLKENAKEGVAFSAERYIKAISE